MEIPFRIIRTIRFRFMYRHTYFSDDFSASTLKYAHETFHFENNLYFDRNERRFHFEFRSRVFIMRNEKWDEPDPE